MCMQDTMPTNVMELWAPIEMPWLNISPEVTKLLNSYPITFGKSVCIMLRGIGLQAHLALFS